MRFRIFLVTLLCFISVAQAEDASKCVGDKHELWTSCTGAIQAESFSYIGDFIDGKPHGEGILEDAFGTKYDGEFRQGKKDGRGEMTFGSEHPLSGSILSLIHI